jgi:hypothetical protein
MTATATATPLDLPAAERRALALYRDDGPLGRALATIGAAAPVPPLLWLAAALLPLFAAIAIAGDDASTLTVAAVVAWLVAAGGSSAGRAPGSRTAWALPPLVRLGEYAALIWIAAVAGPATLPAAFALLSALAFRHYELVYRLRHRGTTPARWVNTVSGGWDGRLAAAVALLAAGALPAGFYLLAGALGAVFVGEAVAGWQGRDGERPPLEFEDEEDEGQ